MLFVKLLNIIVKKAFSNLTTLGNKNIRERANDAVREPEVTVSIIIPFYNDGLYLEDAIKSVLNQTLNNIELILVDDGSTDESVKIARKYAKEYANILYQRQKNSGQGVARNKGLEMSQGKFVYFLDSDDYLEVHAMEKCYQIASSNKCDIITFNSKETKYDASDFNIEYGHRSFLKENMTGLNYLFQSLKNDKFYVPVWLYFYKKDFLKKCKIEFEPVIYEDKIFTLRILYEDPQIIYLDETLHFRRIREMSTMTRQKSIKHLKGAYTNIIRSYEAYLKTRDENMNLKVEMLKFVRRNINIFIGVARCVEDNFEKRELKGMVNKFLLKKPRFFSLRQIIKLRLA